VGDFNDQQELHMFISTPGAARRTLVGLALTGAATAALATPAGADAPTRIDAEYWGVDCVYSVAGGNTVFLFGSGTTDGSEGGVGAFVEASDGSFVAEGFTPDFTFGDSFGTTLDLEGAIFSIAADITRGGPETTPVRERSGNSWTRGTTTETTLDVETTSASYAGQPVDLSGGSCSGQITAFDVFTTEPAATVYRSRDFDSEICDVEGLPDAQVRITGILPNAYVELVLDHGGENVEKAAGEVTLRGGHGTLITEVYDVFTGDQRTSAAISVALERAGRMTQLVEGEDGFVERTTHTPYREEITVSLADGREGTASCFGVASTSHVKIAPHQD
jgi:hypothetical protein